LIKFWKKQSTAREDLNIYKLRIAPTSLQSKANLGIEDYRQKSCIPMASGEMKKEKSSGTGSLVASSEGQTRRSSIFVRVPHSTGKATSRKLSKRVLGGYY